LSIILVLIFGCTPYKKYTPLDFGNDDNQLLQIILDQAVNEFKMPGLQAGVKFSNGKTVLASSGTIDFGRERERITNQAIFRIGSATKMFVSALIGRLVEKELVSFDETIDKWFPDIPAVKNVTIRELLSHTSGIEENLFTSPLILMHSFISDEKKWNSQQVVNDLLRDMDLKLTNQKSFMYANNNYLLLGLIAEKVTGVKLHSQLENEFFIPLKMKDTYLLPHYSEMPIGLVSGYDEYIPFGPHEIKPSNTSWDTLTFSAGAMASTSKDLLIWLDAFFHGRILNADTISMLRAYGDARDNGRDNNIVGYGLGLARYEVGGYTLEGHPGGGFGGECYPFYFPEKNISITVSYNWSKKDNPAGKIVLKRIIDQMLVRASTSMD